MLISLIVAVDEANGIGKDGGIPWRVRSDMQRFKQLTMGHVLIVGRKTWDSIGRPLRGRQMIVVTRQVGWVVDGVQTAGSLEAALQIAQSAGETEAFIGGGAQIFAQTLPQAHSIYLTRIHTMAGCDTFFPSVEWERWQEVEHVDVPIQEGDQFSSTYSKYRLIRTNSVTLA